MNLTLTEPQSEFFQMTEKYPLFVGGYGSGKTMTLVARAITDMLENPGNDIACYSATYDLLSHTVAPYFHNILSRMPVRWKHNGSSNILRITGYGKVIFRSLEVPEKIIGYEVFRSHVDEIDTLRPEKAKLAWKNIIARNRQKPANGMAENQVRAYTSPEGFRFAYSRWVKQATKNYARVHASTASNEHNLPKGYIEGLYESYPENLRRAYLDGEFVNLTSGNVYPNFDRRENHESVNLDEREPLHIGLDFNVMNVNGTVNVLRNGKPRTGGEITSCNDTPHFVEVVKEVYPKNPIVIYPDNNGDSRNTTGASKTDIKILREAGFTVRSVRDEKGHKRNPLIKNRVNCVNAMLLNGNGERHWKIDTDKCPELTEALEQQGWDEKTRMPEKNPDDNVDDINDAAGYFMWSRFPLIKREFGAGGIAA